MAADARQQLSTFALGVVVASLALFVLSATPAAGSRLVVPSLGYSSATLTQPDAPHPMIGAPMAVEKTVKTTPTGNGTSHYDVAVTNLSPEDAITLRYLDDHRLGDMSDLGSCRMPHTIAAGDTFGCGFER